MKAKYNVISKGNPRDREAAPKYYPSFITNGRINERELARLIAESCTLTTVDVMAVVEGLLQILPRLIAEGYIVELGEFGSFRMRIRSKGAESPDMVTAGYILDILPRFTAGKEFKKVLKGATFEKARS
ncbi:MAG: HU family DNA-binding protein [Anaerolineales bacterium]|nr:HU family DNA-binding protein [Anaerolineales bacterium]MCB8986546.1 HU family DNA-binding protein [Ardenticatenaceae bacterium]